jgi:hypothetical protein
MTTRITNAPGNASRPDVQALVLAQATPGSRTLVPDELGRNNGNWHAVDIGNGRYIQVRFASWQGNDPVFQAKGKTATLLPLPGFNSFSSAAAFAGEKARGGAIQAFASNPFQSIADLKVGNTNLGQLTNQGLQAVGDLVKKAPLPLLGVTPQQASRAYVKTAAVVNNTSTALLGRAVLPNAVLPSPVKPLEVYKGKVFGGEVTATPEMINGRQHWVVQWEGPQGITSLTVPLKGQFGDRQLAKGTFTKDAIGKFVKSVNQHWAQAKKEPAPVVERPTPLRNAVGQTVAAGTITPETWAAQTLQSLEQQPVRLNAIDTQLGLVRGPASDWFSQGVDGSAGALGYAVGYLGKPPDTPTQALFGKNRGDWVLQQLTQDEVPVDDQGGFNLPNNANGGKYLAALVAETGRAGDFSGTGFHNVKAVGDRLDSLAKKYGLSPAFVRAYRDTQNQMAIDGAISTAQTLVAMRHLVKTSRPSRTQRPPPSRDPVMSRVNGIQHGQPTKVSPNARNIEVKPLQPPVVKVPLEVNVDPKPRVLPDQKVTPQKTLPDANTIDVTAQVISSKKIKPSNTLPSSEMRNPQPTPTPTPLGLRSDEMNKVAPLGNQPEVRQAVPPKNKTPPPTPHRSDNTDPQEKPKQSKQGTNTTSGLVDSKNARSPSDPSQVHNDGSGLPRPSSDKTQPRRHPLVPAQVVKKPIPNDLQAPIVLGRTLRAATARLDALLPPWEAKANSNGSYDVWAAQAGRTALAFVGVLFLNADGQYVFNNGYAVRRSQSTAPKEPTDDNVPLIAIKNRPIPSKLPAGEVIKASTAEALDWMQKQPPGTKVFALLRFANRPGNGIDKTVSVEGRIEHVGKGQVQFVPTRSASGSGPFGFTESSPLQAYKWPVRDIYLSDRYIEQPENYWIHSSANRKGQNQYKLLEAAVLQEYGKYLSREKGAPIRTPMSHRTETVSWAEMARRKGSGDYAGSYFPSTRQIIIREDQVDGYAFTHEILHSFSSEAYYDRLYEALTDEGALATDEGLTDLFTRHLHIKGQSITSEYDGYVKTILKMIENGLSIETLKRAYFKGEADAVDELIEHLPDHYKSPVTGQP